MAQYANSDGAVTPESVSRPASDSLFRNPADYAVRLLRVWIEKTALILLDLFGLVLLLISLFFPAIQPARWVSVAVLGVSLLAAVYVLDAEQQAKIRRLSAQLEKEQAFREAPQVDIELHPLHTRWSMIRGLSFGPDIDEMTQADPDKVVPETLTLVMQCSLGNRGAEPGSLRSVEVVISPLPALLAPYGRPSWYERGEPMALPQVVAAHSFIDQVICEVTLEFTENDAERIATRLGEMCPATSCVLTLHYTYLGIDGRVQQRREDSPLSFAVLVREIVEQWSCLERWDLVGLVEEGHR